MLYKLKRGKLTGYTTLKSVNLVIILTLNHKALLKTIYVLHHFTWMPTALFSISLKVAWCFDMKKEIKCSGI